MNGRRFLILLPALLLVFGQAAADDGTRAFRGSDPDGSTDRGVAAPPAGAQPVPLLRIDPDEAARGLPATGPDAIVKGFGTVTRRFDGSVVRTGPSPELEREIRGRLGGAPSPDGGGEPGADAEDPVFAQDRAIVGDDSRIRVRENTSFPFRAFGLLYVTRASGAGTCTATLIGPRTIITAAHCVYGHDKGGWVDTITFYPGANGDGGFPYKGYAPDQAHVLQGFIDNYEGFYGSVAHWDLAVVTLTEKAGDRLGWLDFRRNDRSGFRAYNVGYPGDKPYASMWRDRCDVDSFLVFPTELYHRCDTWSGSSGSSMYSYQAKPENRRVEAVHVAEMINVDRNLSLNIAVPLNSSYYGWVAQHRR